MEWNGMEAFLYIEGIQLIATHSGGQCSDLPLYKINSIDTSLRKSGTLIF